MITMTRKEVVCPMRKATKKNGLDAVETFLPCLEGECAWYNSEIHQCDPTGLATKHF